MNDASAPTPDLDDPALDRAAERVARQTRVLAELAEIGLRVARLLERQAEAQVASAPTEAPKSGEANGGAAAARMDLGLSYSRLTRAIRLTQVLETQIDEGEVARRALAAETRARQATATREAAHDAWTQAREKLVLEVVEQALEADGEDDETILDRLDEAREKFEFYPEDFDVAGLPVGLIVERLCKDFNVEPDWSLWADAPWAIEEAQDRPRGSPYARAKRAAGAGAAEDPPQAGLSEPVPKGGSSP